MADTLLDADAVVTDETCGICLEGSRDPLHLPCGHSFCDGCLDRWRSRYGVWEERRRKCPICRARIPPSKEMVQTMKHWRGLKQKMDRNNNTSSEVYADLCTLLGQSEEHVGADWDGVTVLEHKNDEETPMVMPDYIFKAIRKRDIRSVLGWINANRSEDRANAISYYDGSLDMTALMEATRYNQLMLSTLLLQLGADVNYRLIDGASAVHLVFCKRVLTEGRNLIKRAQLLLSWGANFFPEYGRSKEDCVSRARDFGRHEVANLLESELGGRRCEIVDLTSKPQLNGKTCVTDECLPDSNQYKVTLETKNEEKLILNAGNLKRRDRTPQDCGYFVEYKYGHMIVHDFDSSEECQAFVAETQPVVTKEAVARAEQAAAELLAELGLDDSQVFKVLTSNDQAKRSKKKKGGKKKMRKM